MGMVRKEEHENEMKVHAQDNVHDKMDDVKAMEESKESQLKDEIGMGTSGADNTMKDMQSMSDSNQMKGAGIMAASGTLPGMNNNSADEKKVNFNESKNEISSVAKDPSKAFPAPNEDELVEKAHKADKEIQNDNNNLSKKDLDTITDAIPASQLSNTCELYNLKSSLVIEGPVKKRMFFCPCFWHSRYFALTNEGILMYFAKPDGKSKGHINLKEEIESIKRINETDEIFKIFMKYTEGSVESLRFDDERVRDAWNRKMQAFLD